MQNPEKMNNNEIMSLWKSYDQKIESLLTINRDLVIHLTKSKLDKKMNLLKRPKSIFILMGIPYIIILWSLTIVAFKASGVFVTIGFGSIAILMSILVGAYFYQIHLINKIIRSEEIIVVQENLARLRISSFNCIRLSVIQLPFWIICWMSFDALVSSPLIYGGIHLILIGLFAYLAYWIYSGLSIENRNPKISEFFLSGNEWDLLEKSSELLDQIKQLK